MTREELDRVLELHRKLLAGEGGQRADLRGANLSGAHLYRANLRYANLYEANLRGADLHGADLTGAGLYEANLSGANLSGVNLTDAFLYGANLGGVRTNWLTRMTARGNRNLTDKQRRQLGMRPPPRAGNARRCRNATDLARRLSR